MWVRRVGENEYLQVEREQDKLVRVWVRVWARMSIIISMGVSTVQSPRTRKEKTIPLDR